MRFRVRLDTAGVPGINDPDQLLILKRENSNSAWTPLNTTRDGGELVSSSLTSFSEFAIGANKATNPLPVESESAAPQTFQLHGAFPNPFRDQATIRYELPEKRRVTVAVYDVMGRKVKTLVDEEQKGRQAITFEASTLPAGMYFYRITAGAFTETRRMVVTR